MNIVVLLSVGFAFVIVLIYSAVLMIISNRINRITKSNHTSISTDKDDLPLPDISVIIPVRNEAEHLPVLLDDLRRLSYPGRYEMVIIDDHSTDKTRKVIAAGKWDSLKYVALKEGQSGKKTALTQGVKESSYDLILCTDGDVRIPWDWLKRVGENYSKERWDFCASPVFCTKMKGALAHFQSMEYLGMAAITHWGILSRCFYLANGANMSFNKNAFLKVGGYQNNIDIASGDDVFLVNQMAARRMHITFNPLSKIYTYPLRSWRDIISQRMRWGGKNKHQKSTTFHSLILLTGMANMAIWLFIVVMIIQGDNLWYFALSGILIKLMADYYYLRNLASVYVEEWGGTGSFITAWIINLIYITLVAPWSLLIPETMWKGRAIQTGA